MREKVAAPSMRMSRGTAPRHLLHRGYDTGPTRRHVDFRIRVCRVAVKRAGRHRKHINGRATRVRLRHAAPERNRISLAGRRQQGLRLRDARRATAARRWQPPEPSAPQPATPKPGPAPACAAPPFRNDLFLSVRTSPREFSGSCSSDGDGATVARPRRIQKRPSSENGSYPRWCLAHADRPAAPPGEVERRVPARTTRPLRRAVATLSLRQLHHVPVPVREREQPPNSGLVSTARGCGRRRHRQPNSVRVCSPASRRLATLGPRYAGLTALTPAPRTLVQTGSCVTMPSHDPLHVVVGDLSSEVVPLFRTTG